MARKKAAEKLAETRNNLKSSKNELEVALQNFTFEQEKMHDNYEKRKQDITEKVELLRKELEKLEVDTSVEIRKAACDSLNNAIKALQSRMPATADT